MSEAMSLPPSLTDAHRRALEWLPEDGSWEYPTKHTSAALSSLARKHPELVESYRLTSFISYRLTPAGIELMKRAKE